MHVAFYRINIVDWRKLCHNKFQ